MSKDSGIIEEFEQVFASFSTKTHELDKGHELYNAVKAHLKQSIDSGSIRKAVLEGQKKSLGEIVKKAREEHRKKDAPEYGEPNFYIEIVHEIDRIRAELTKLGEPK